MDNKLHLLDFLPLAIFSWGPSILGFEQGSWQQAFYLGSTAAAIQILYTWYRGHSFDYIALGANLFMIYGALGYALYPRMLLPYDLLKQSIIFVWVFIIGLITTLITPEGFIQGPVSAKQYNLTGSIGLLCLTALALVISYSLLTITSANTAVSTIMPFVGLLATRALLKNYVETSLKAS